MRLMCAFTLAACGAAVSGTSDGGKDIFECDVRSPIYGCDENGYANKEDRFSCILATKTESTPAGTGNLEMSWALKAKPTDAYVLFAGATPDTASSVGFYVPGKLNRIHVQTTLLERNFRGLMMNARDASNKVVGDWEVPKEAPAAYRLPAAERSAACKGTLLHANASPKGLMTTFLFRAPPAGTGAITIDALIKSGGANEGNFWWPKSKLVLQERESPVTGAWVRSKAGESCSQACSAAGKGACNANVLQQVTDGAVLDVFARFEFPCQYPLV